MTRSGRVGTYSYTVHGAGCRFVSDNGTEVDVDFAADESEVFDLWRLRRYGLSRDQGFDAALPQQAAVPTRPLKTTLRVRWDSRRAKWDETPHVCEAARLESHTERRSSKTQAPVPERAPAPQATRTSVKPNCQSSTFGDFAQPSVTQQSDYTLDHTRSLLPSERERTSYALCTRFVLVSYAS
ncbi:DUF6896 domain-containing protein [Streptomyces sp. NBC_01013]|uniref:DUF6896 domain-containing protein n=1 Tax=Streptomyces sp. NBC_01013 TaxID=2903718 RepID=UPI00386E1240